MNRINTPDTRRIYLQAKRKVKQICREKKRIYWETQLQIIENHIINKDIRNFYQEIKKNKTLGQRTNFYRSKGETLIGDIHGKLNRWVKYFRELLNPESGANEGLVMDFKLC
ncbi:hypothetical protein QE152_g30201 [Popillia japonica]|uniref:Reverse transcriptase n=1 Tax=Popillia japonica TaxID=7064 RepID=A0AAW1JFJ6_POPJA